MRMEGERKEVELQLARPPPQPLLAPLLPLGSALALNRLIRVQPGTCPRQGPCRSGGAPRGLQLTGPGLPSSSASLR